MSQLFSQITPLPPKEMNYKKMDPRTITLYLLDNKRREKLDVYARESIKYSQNSRYEKALTVSELEKMEQAPVELRYFVRLFWGLDEPTFSKKNIEEIQRRLDSLHERLKTSYLKKGTQRSKKYHDLCKDCTFAAPLLGVWYTPY